MLEVLQFVFSGFWHWLGSAILLFIISHGLGRMFNVNIKKTVTNDSFNDIDED